MKKRKVLCLLIIIALLILVHSKSTVYAIQEIYSDVTVFNMNDFSVYKGRTKDDIITKFSKAAPSNYSATLYDTSGSEKSPYKESTLTSTTKTNALNLSNYYRWLAGLTTLSSSSNEKWSNAAKGAVLLAASEFSHTPAQPSDMSDDFYKAAYNGTAASNIAMNGAINQYKLIYTIRQFMNDEGYEIPLHRSDFLTRNANSIAYGISSVYVCQTIECKNDPNPSGTATVNNNQAAYAWPAPGYFPAEDLSKSAYWTVNLNTDKLDISNVGLIVTIEDLDTGKKYNRTSSSNGLYTTDYWGKFICFAPPEDAPDSYAGKRYKITLENLYDENNLPAKLEYTVNFFSYEGNYTIDGVKYYCNQYGELTKLKNISSMKVKLAYTSKAYSGKKLTPTVTISGLKNGTDYTVKYSNNINPGKATVTITGKGKYTGTIKKSYIIKPAQVKNAKVTTQSTNSVSISWSKVTGATAYKIYQYDYSKKQYYYVGKTKDTKFTIKNLKAGTIYKFRVRAYKNVDGTQYFGTYAPTIRTATKPVATKVTSISSKSKTVLLNWKKVSGASGYRIYMSTSKNGTYTAIKTTSASNYTKSGLKKGKTYYFKIRVYTTVNDTKIFSSYSKVYSIKVK